MKGKNNLSKNKIEKKPISDKLKMKIEKLYPKFKSIEDVHEYYLKIISCMPNNIYWLNRSCIALGCNENVLKLIGLKKLDEFVGITYEKMGEMAGWTEGQAMSFKKDDMEVMESGVAKYYVEEPPLYDDEGNPVYYMSSRVPLFDEKNNTIGVVGISVDITKQKLAEKALADQVEKTKQAYASKSSFISISSHEVIGPVGNAISAANEIIEGVKEGKNLLKQWVDKNNGAEMVPSLNEIFENSINNLLIINSENYRAINSLKNMLEINRLQTEGIEVNFEYAKIASLINEAIKNNSNHHNIKFNIKLNKSVPEEVKLDYSNVADALKLVVGNAIKYSTPNGVIDILVDSSKKDLLISVKDHGLGMKASQIENLPNTFFNADATQSKNYIKPSILLSQVKMKVEASGGSIQIDSQENKGTTVTLKVPFLPFVTTKQSKKAAINVVPPAAAKSTKSLKFLLIEDDQLTQRSHKRIFEQLGHQVDCAVNGAEAIRLGQKNHYDIIWLDITLPDKNGLEVMSAIKKVANQLTPFVATTSYSSQQNYEAFMKQGVVTVLTKPIEKADFVDCIQSIILANEDKDI